MRSDKIPFPANDEAAWRVKTFMPCTNPRVTFEWIQNSAGIYMWLDDRQPPIYIGSYEEVEKLFAQFFTRTEEIRTGEMDNK